MSPLNRREVLAKSLLAGGALCAADEAFAFKDSKQNAIMLENLKPGTLDWQLSYTRTDTKDKLRCPIIEVLHLEPVFLLVKLLLFCQCFNSS